MLNKTSFEQLAEVADVSEQRRRRSYRAYQPLDAQGMLTKERPDDGAIRWSQVPVGAVAAQDLFVSFTQRERELLWALEERRYLTIEQVARRFYGSRARAYQMLTALFGLRFVACFERTPYWMGRALGVANRPPRIYFLDWNGNFLLEAERSGTQRRGRPGQATRWKPDSIGIPNSITGHLLGTNELWSLLFDAARQTQRKAGKGEAMSLEWLGEAEARVSYGPRRNQEIAPDAELILRVGPGVVAGEIGRQLTDWELADLAQLDQVDGDWEEGARYRTILLEYETGVHRDVAVIEKIEGYNALLARPAAWQERYGGGFPRLLVVVREAAQLKRMGELWRKHYKFPRQPDPRDCPLLLTSMEHLRHAAGQSDGVLGNCWQHALDPQAAPGEGGSWLNFGEALGIGDLE